MLHSGEPVLSFRPHPNHLSIAPLTEKGGRVFGVLLDGPPPVPDEWLMRMAKTAGPMIEMIWRREQVSPHPSLWVLLLLPVGASCLCSPSLLARAARHRHQGGTGVGAGLREHACAPHALELTDRPTRRADPIRSDDSCSASGLSAPQTFAPHAATLEQQDAEPIEHMAKHPLGKRRSSAGQPGGGARRGSVSTRDSSGGPERLSKRDSVKGAHAVTGGGGGGAGRCAPSPPLAP